MHNHQALLPVEHECFEYLMRVHLEGFLATPEYRQLVRSGRRTVLLMYYNLKTGKEQRCGAVAPASAEHAEPAEPAEMTVVNSMSVVTHNGTPDSPAHGTGNDVSGKASGTVSTVETHHLFSGRVHVQSAAALEIHEIDEGDALHELENDACAAGLSSQPQSPQQPSPPHRCSSPQAYPGKNVNALDSAELTAWLARGGRRNSTYTASSGSTQLGPCSLAASELFSPVNHADMRELKNFIR